MDLRNVQNDNRSKMSTIENDIEYSDGTSGFVTFRSGADESAKTSEFEHITSMDKCFENNTSVTQDDDCYRNVVEIARANTKYLISMPEESFHTSLVEKKSVHPICDLCKKYNDDSQMLPCFHCFCLPCVAEIVISQRTSTTRPNGGVPTLDLNLACYNESKGRANLAYSIMCPMCTSQNESPALPEKSPLSSLADQKHIVSCTSCIEEICSVAVYKCEICEDFLCEMCAAFHKRQRKTRGHALCNLNSRDPSQQEIQTDVCSKHNLEIIKLYCKTCDTFLCEICSLEDHTMHDHGDIVTLVEQYRDKLSILKEDYIAREKDIISSITLAREREDLIKSNSDRVCNEVNSYYGRFIAAVEKHRLHLLKQNENITKQQLEQSRTHMLTLLDMWRECNRIAGIIKELDETCSLKEKYDTCILKLYKNKIRVVDRAVSDLCLRNTMNGQVDYLTFCPEAMAGVIDNFQMYGQISGTKVLQEKCHISGEGTETARVGHKSNVTVHLRDEYGSAVYRPMTIKSYLIKCGSTQRSITSSVQRNSDATYSICFIPHEPGQHKLVIDVEARPIQGSPFCFNVKPKRREHTGKWHCCTFCATHGQMDEKCVHGTSVLGFGGCTHGNIGHPGGPHWSCCGKMTEKSECLSLPSNRKFRSLSRGHMYNGDKKSMIRDVTL